MTFTITTTTTTMACLFFSCLLFEKTNYERERERERETLKIPFYTLIV